MIRPWPAEDDHYSEEAFADDETFQRVLRSADQVGGLMTLGLLPIRSDKPPSPGSLSFSGITRCLHHYGRGYYCRPAPPCAHAHPRSPSCSFLLVDAYEPGGVYSWCAYRTTWPRARPPFEDSSWTSWSSRSWGLTLSPTSCRSRDWLRCRQEKATRIFFRVLSCLLFSWTFVVERYIGYWYISARCCYLRSPQRRGFVALLWVSALTMSCPPPLRATVPLVSPQVAFWGHPDTSGVRNVDYFVSSEIEVADADRCVPAC